MAKQKTSKTLTLAEAKKQLTTAKKENADLTKKIDQMEQTWLPPDKAKKLDESVQAMEKNHGELIKKKEQQIDVQAKQISDLKKQLNDAVNNPSIPDDYKESIRAEVLAEIAERMENEQEIAEAQANEQEAEEVKFFSPSPSIVRDGKSFKVVKNPSHILGLFREEQVSGYRALFTAQQIPVIVEEVPEEYQEKDKRIGDNKYIIYEAQMVNVNTSRPIATPETTEVEDTIEAMEKEEGGNDGQA